MTISTQAIDVLARTIYGEARGELYKTNGGLSALMGVANVINNRVKQKLWYGATHEDVCMKPYQFSCWNKDNPNYTVIRNVNVKHDKVFQKCLEIAELTANEQWPDLTHGSDHYHAVWMPRAPLWAMGKKPLAKLGCHIFYNLNGKL